MGCDIHLYTEKKVPDRLNHTTKWWCCDHFQLDCDDDGNIEAYGVVHLYDGRDYELFSALADVRNRGTVEPIDEPRGLPDDVSPIIRKEAEQWADDGHSCSWLTAKELFVYQNRHPVITYSGMLEPEQFKDLDEKGIIPTHWCQWTNKEGCEYREWVVPGSPVDYLVEAVKRRMAEEFYIWDFLSDKEKEDKYWEHAEEFRVVFWFDN